MSAPVFILCQGCKRNLDGEPAWADDVHVIGPDGVRLMTRYTCDDCAEGVA